MRKRLVLASVLTLTGVIGYLGVRRVEGNVSEQPAFDRETRAVVGATTTFLKALNPEQRRRLQLAFTPQQSAPLCLFFGLPSVNRKYLGGAGTSINDVGLQENLEVPLRT